MRGLIFSVLAVISSYSFALPRINVVTEEWVPYNYTNKQGEVVGRTTKKVKEVLHAAGFSYEIRSYPWIRSMRLAQINKNTMIYSIYPTKKRQPLYQWLCPLMQPVKEYLFKLRSRKDIEISSLNDAKKYIISIVNGSVVHEYLKTQGFKNQENLDLTYDPDASPRKLLAGRVDLILTTEYTASVMMKKLKLEYSKLEIVYEVKNTDERRACMAFSLDTDKKIIDRIRHALEEYNRKHIGP